jgi:hypothetical protein
VNSSTTTAIFKSGDAKSVALGSKEAANDPNLTAVIEGWPTLPEATKAGILAIVRVAELANPIHRARDPKGSALRLGRWKSRDESALESGAKWKCRVGAGSIRPLIGRPCRRRHYRTHLVQ